MYLKEEILVLRDKTKSQNRTKEVILVDQLQIITPIAKEIQTSTGIKIAFLATTQHRIEKTLTKNILATTFFLRIKSTEKSRLQGYSISHLSTTARDKS